MSDGAGLLLRRNRCNIWARAGSSTSVARAHSRQEYQRICTAPAIMRTLLGFDPHVSRSSPSTSSSGRPSSRCEASYRRASSLRLSSTSYNRFFSLLLALHLCMALLEPAGPRWKREDIERVLASLAHDPTAINRCDRRGCSPLWYAVSLGLVDLVDELLARGADPNPTDPAHKTLLYRAAMQRNLHMVTSLIRAGTSQMALLLRV